MNEGQKVAKEAEKEQQAKPIAAAVRAAERVDASEARQLETLTAIGTEGTPAAPGEARNQAMILGEQMASTMSDFAKMAGYSLERTDCALFGKLSKQWDALRTTSTAPANADTDTGSAA